MRVDFIIIGAQKSATSSLAMQLSEHPQVCFCEKKEPDFFSRTEDWRSNIEQYHRLFSPKEGQICGEASVSYTYFPEYPHVPESLYAYNPNLKLIYIMRDPVERIISHYMNRVVLGKCKQTIEVAIYGDPTYINRSRYGVQLRSYFRFFSKENFLLLTFDEFTQSPMEAWRKICGFLDIHMPPPESYDAPARNVSLERRHIKRFPGSGRIDRLIKKWPSGAQAMLPGFLFNKVDSKPKLSAAHRRNLWLLLEDDVDYVETLMGRDGRTSAWRKKYNGVGSADLTFAP